MADSPGKSVAYFLCVGVEMTVSENCVFVFVFVYFYVTLDFFKSLLDVGNNVVSVFNTY